MSHRQHTLKNNAEQIKGYILCERLRGCVCNIVRHEQSAPEGKGICKVAVIHEAILPISHTKDHSWSEGNETARIQAHWCKYIKVAEQTQTRRADALLDQIVSAPLHVLMAWFNAALLG